MEKGPGQNTLVRPSVFDTQAQAAGQNSSAPDYGEKAGKAKTLRELAASDLIPPPSGTFGATAKPEKAVEDASLHLRVAQLEAAVGDAMGLLDKCAAHMASLEARREFSSPQVVSGSLEQEAPAPRLLRAWEARRVTLETDVGREACRRADRLLDEGARFEEACELLTAGIASNARSAKARELDLMERQEALRRAMEGDIAALKRLWL